jgi:DNA gyrase subunit B
MPKDKTNQTPESSYSAKNITVLEGLEHVRKRPGMYIGSTGPTGLHHLIWEVFDNSIDEAMGGYCSEITVTLLPNHQVQVRDNGRGIPVDIHPQQKVSALEVVMTKLNAGGKFGGEGYKISGGLHGVGVSVVNALSVYTKAEVHRDGKVWVQEYKKGAPVAKVKAVGNCTDTGTTVTFQPDDSIFETTDFEWKTIIDHLRQHSYLTKGIHVIVKDERSVEEKKVDKTALQFPIPIYQFYFEGGVASYVRYLNHNKEIKNENIFYIEKEAEEVQVELALQYSNDFSESLFAFTNNIFNPEGGTHVAGFRTALTRSLNTYARNKGFLKEKDANLTGEDVREGLTTVISVKIREPQFEGQTKAKLGNTEAKTAVETVMNEGFLIFLEEHPKDAEAIIGKCLLAAKARAAAKIARDTILRKGALEGFTLPGKLADCSSRNAEDSELFIVEGDSAGGSAKQGRDREHQAILPLRGKVLNVERARLDKILTNNELKSLIIALGTNIGEQFDIAKLRYHRIVIMTDADVDGGTNNCDVRQGINLRLVVLVAEKLLRKNVVQILKLKS